MDYIHILKKYLHTQHHVYIREAHTDTAIYILYHIYIEDFHTDITALTVAT